jgi:hypothetical protein
MGPSQLPVFMSDSAQNTHSYTDTSGHHGVLQLAQVQVFQHRTYELAQDPEPEVG